MYRTRARACSTVPTNPPLYCDFRRVSPNYSCLVAMVYVGGGVACFAAQLYPAYRTSTALSLLDLVVLLDCEAIPFEPFTSSLPWI